MKRTAIATLLLAAATAPSSAQSNIPALTTVPNLEVLRAGDKNLMIDRDLLVRLLEDPDPAMNNPDKVAWELFVKVNAPAASSGNNNALFETWASNDDTFKQNPVWPGPALVAKTLRVPALIASAPRRPGLAPHVTPGGSEEVRRNKPAFDFIVSNKLYLRSGLKTAFTAGSAPNGRPISFPTDAIEVKANWVPVAQVADASKYHVNTASDGKQYALVAMHVISKQVPNWTWATFEHQDNKGRCDIIGCHDAFGATQHNVNSKTPSGGTYPACGKTGALTKMMTDGKLEAAYSNYCLKGSQVDFTTSTGLITHLGNSVTESGFVDTSSCLTCHSRAAVDKNGLNVYGGGFVGNGSPNGSPLSSWFWNNPGKSNQSLKAYQTDFVWSIPREAI